VTELEPVAASPASASSDVPAEDTELSGFDPGRLAGVSAIWVRELRGRMRGKRAFIFLTFYLCLLTTLLWLALRTTESMTGLSALESTSIGRGIFGGVLLIETLVVVGLAPAYTAGAITSEREKQTYDLLAVTPISSVAIILGKLFSGLSYLALIVFASLPIACLGFVFGGIGPEDLVRGYIVLILSGLGIGAIGVWCSAAMSRTQSATVAAFILTGALVVGASALWLALDSRAEERSPERPPLALLMLNPFVAQLDVICQATGEACFAQQAAIPRDVDPFTGARFDTNGQLGGVAPLEFGVRPIPAGGEFWPKAALLYLGIAILGVFAAAQSISPTRRWRPTLKLPRFRLPEAPTDD
jgi:ABC-type transport system involved in multi-copper enzyme maturation permease subunit